MEETRRALVRMLQDAHAGELAAAFAYRGHAIQVIEAAEWHHRETATLSGRGPRSGSLFRPGFASQDRP